MGCLRALPALCLVLSLAWESLLSLQFEVYPEPHLTQVCTMDMDEGPCRGTIPRYYYDRYTQRCREFEFGGCEGNKNNFESLKSCRMACRHIRRVPKVCRHKAETGFCRASLQHYFYNLSSGLCEGFVYGGCGGNRNRFHNMKACIHRCNDPHKGISSACRDPADQGACTGNFTRFFFDVKKRTCELFKYGGCGGNNNNFQNIKICLTTCKQDIPSGNMALFSRRGRRLQRRRQHRMRMFRRMQQQE
uniref:tissue factor pathway inhibitor 2-like isoform X1 n=1 Tax=Myxine glutinosa TaxID=7769 RepID=UPI00358F3132